MMEALLLIVGLTAVNLAMAAVFDLLAGTRPWPRKAVWALLVLGLPLLGPVLYYLHAPRERARISTKRRSASSTRARLNRHDERPETRRPEEPEAADDLAAKVKPVDREHA